MDELRFTRNERPITNGPGYIFIATTTLIVSQLHRDVCDWCEENIRGSWGTHGAGCFYFYDEADAFQFKLRWV